MFAIVEVAGQQFKVEKDENIFVHRLQNKEGDKIVLDQVLLVEEDGKTVVGSPVVKGYQVKATVVSHLKGDKVKVFKKKRRKGYQKLNGHRQYLTEIRIDAIGKGKAAPKAEEKKETPAAKTKAPAKAAPKAGAAPKKAETAKKAGTKTTTAKKTATTGKTAGAAAARKTATAKAKSPAATTQKPAAKKNDDKKEEK